MSLSLITESLIQLFNDYSVSSNSECNELDRDKCNKKLMGLKVQKYSNITLIISLFLICLVLPFYHKLTLTNSFFKVQHIIRHHLLYKHFNWLIHHTLFYHNQSLQICLFWSILISFITIYNTNWDFKEITKRCGRISVSLLPIVLMLSLRPSPLPKKLNLLYLSLLPLHKWISRILIFQATLHSALYTWWYYENGKLKLKLLKLTNIYGILALLLFVIIGFTSIRKFRRFNFKLFYYIHYISTWLTILLLYLHSKPGIPYYALSCVSILLFQIVYRLRHTKLTKVSIVCISPCISLLEFPAEALSNKPILPAAHVRINLKSKNVWKRWINHIIPFQHPFTVANLPNEDTVQLIIRNGNTLPLITNGDYYITGVFEPMIDFITKPCTLTEESLHNFHFQVKSLPLLNSPLRYQINARRVFMCVGGSAISFALPVLRILNFNGVHVRLIWVTRDYRDLKLLNHFRNNFEGLEVFVSGENSIEYIEHETLTSLDSASPNSYLDEPPLNSKSKLLSGFNSPATYGSTVDQSDEIDFTQTFTVKKLKSKSKLSAELRTATNSSTDNISAFRKPSIIEPPNAFGTDNISVNYNSTLDTISPPYTESKPKIKIPAGIKVSFGRPLLDNSHYTWCLEKECIGPSETNQCYNSDNKDDTHVDDLASVWVVAAGPESLVENTKRWAKDGGLHFYEESFAV
ncbi:hypothetical protein Kpol_1010p50 [Vanderwaltozyma polyspora DSM 70294]|uniref:Ferric oxidoreductase domain-containing protein n=1 Tax=Vanderwaltozyma polyspora (strain ATCC 22028 / DSM 70294 / BCRC 21397 / CBS 2163 / NBRC 10782 / NRRL Y-8283 / UCD 57-17) TaxID=436907 RepID=A7TIJ6_VANPO|nr:uncharacterized protein Kpol_1010p50 [Vanderwaltozyma polyspora DSM 70294]EDO17934.1 hypothetical protein Kpol_1010p50 [Vanderwaltozyma polyspora DSM 70294]